MNIKARIAASLLATLLLAACGGGGLSGTYTGAAGNYFYRFTFEPNGKVEVSTDGVVETEMDYEVRGNTLKVGFKGGAMQDMRIEEDGSIVGPHGVGLTKEQ